MVDYEQSLFFLSSVEQNARHANGHARDWWREMGEAAALVSRVSRLRRSRASALPLQDLMKKRDCSQSTRMAWLPRNSSIQATCSNLICCKRGLIRGWWNGQYSFTTRFSAMFKKNCTFFSPVCGILKLENWAIYSTCWMTREKRIDDWLARNPTQHCICPLEEIKPAKFNALLVQTKKHSIIPLFSWCRLQHDWVCHQHLLSLVIAFTCLSSSSLFRDV